MRPLLAFVFCLDFFNIYFQTGGASVEFWRKFLFCSLLLLQQTNSASFLISPYSSLLRLSGPGLAPSPEKRGNLIWWGGWLCFSCLLSLFVASPVLRTDAHLLWWCFWGEFGSRLWLHSHAHMCRQVGLVHYKAWETHSHTNSLKSSCTL